MSRTRFRGTIRRRGGQRLVLQPGDDDHLALRDVGQTVVDDVVDVQPHETRHRCSSRCRRAGEIRCARNPDTGRAHPRRCRPARWPDPSENDTTHAFDAEYVEARPDSSPATLATLMTVPCAGVDHRRQCRAGEVHDRGDVDVELGLQHLRVGGPEFAGRAEAGVVHQYAHTLGQPLGDRARPSASARSATRTSLLVPCSSRSSSASSWSVRRRARPARGRSRRRRSAVAKPAPMPEVGPVIRATGRGIRGYGW